MHETRNRSSVLSRRAILTGAAVSAVGLVITEPEFAGSASPPQLPMVTVAPGLDIVTREGWATNRPPRGAIQVESDVRFLLVHHTAEPGNDYGPGEAPRLLRGMYDYHTGPAKRWPDIAYNFLIDQFGVVYEGRSGSLTQASQPDATGGSQGFSQLACFIGNFDKQAPTTAALDSMVRVLAYLAERYGIDISPGATTDFVSRGSNRYPAGAPVHTKTVAGHRDMSNTTCPGDFVYAMIQDNSLAARASEILQASATTTTVSASTTTATASTTVESPTLPPSTPSSETTVPLVGSTHEPATKSADNSSSGLFVVGGALALGAAAVVPLLLRRSHQHNVAVATKSFDDASRGETFNRISETKEESQ